MTKIFMVLSMLFAVIAVSASALAQVRLQPGDSATINGVHVTCGGGGYPGPILVGVVVGIDYQGAHSNCLIAGGSYITNCSYNPNGTMTCQCYR